MSIYSVALNNLTWESSIIKKEKASPPCSAPSDSGLIRNIK